MREQKRPKVKKIPMTEFPIVAIGASAGGLRAFEAFFSAIPNDTDLDMAFILIQHLAPDHKSLLTDIIQKYTNMQVFEVKDGMRIEPNCVYVIPPAHDMALLNGSLQLLEPSAPRGHRLPIDFFFRSLAQDQHKRAIAIILSGTGSDGTKGIEAIKENGGIVIAQNLDSSEYDGMPSSAIATGLVDYVLAPDQMPNHLIAYSNYAVKKLHTIAPATTPKEENVLKKIFVLLRDQTSHDFSQYKPSTIHRRIQRCMAVQKIETIDNYTKYLQQTPDEINALFHDLLIGVTNFFRDPEAFLLLKEQIITKIFTRKSSESTIRVWTTGCSSGEEAYSIAILLKECMEEMKQNYTVQIFATDIDAKAIAIARIGLYPPSITDNLSPERLTRFFTPQTDNSGYRIQKSIRDMLVFSEQNVIKDPPFSKLDLISCRNLLIYMGPQLQKKLIPLFHYALNPGGILFLGSSEGVGDFSDLFSVLDQQSKLYQCTEDSHAAQITASKRFFSPSTAIPISSQNVVEKIANPAKVPMRELTEQTLLKQCTLTGILVNDKGDILYLHGRPDMYLKLPSGEPNVNNILKMAREGLRHELTSALRKVAMSKQIGHSLGLHIKRAHRIITVNITIHPLELKQKLPVYLVIIEEVPSINPEHTPHSIMTINPLHDRDTRLEELQHELYTQEDFLNAANDKLETSNDELTSFNEEMQSLNEELQSSNEELETSKEELQSLNEELSTVNAELQTKITDLSHSNNDMNNLLAGTGIGTLFVDHNLHILRFTPSITNIIHLIPSDLGRPVGHIASNLIGYESLVTDTQEVLDTLIPKEIEVQNAKKMWYTLRIQPYRTLDNIIEGAVISFVDITETVQMREALRHANELSRLAVVVRDAHDAITVQDLDGRIISWNSGAVRMYGWSESEALAMNVSDRIPEKQRKKALAKLHELSQDEILKPYRTTRITKKGEIVEVWMTSTALVDENGVMYAIATTERAREQKLPQKSI